MDKSQLFIFARLLVFGRLLIFGRFFIFGILLQLVKRFFLASEKEFQIFKSKNIPKIKRPRVAKLNQLRQSRQFESCWQLFNVKVKNLDLIINLSLYLTQHSLYFFVVRQATMLALFGIKINKFAFSCFSAQICSYLLKLSSMQIIIFRFLGENVSLKLAFAERVQIFLKLVASVPSSTEISLKIRSAVSKNPASQLLSNEVIQSIVKL